MIPRQTVIKLLLSLAIVSCIIFTAVILNSYGVMMPYAREVRESNKHIKAVDAHKKADFIFGFGQVKKKLLDQLETQKMHKKEQEKKEDGENKNSDEDVTNKETTTTNSVNKKTLLDNHQEVDDELQTHLLDLDAVAKASSSCPLPILHPEKFQPIMHWGERKKFPSCKSTRGNFSRMERRRRRGRKNSDGENNNNEIDDELVIIVDSSKCSHSTVYEFGEMTNSNFQRMHSVYDAEQRQNELKDKYKQVHQFAKQVKNHPESHHQQHEIEFVLSKPYAVVECGLSADTRETEVHVSAPKQVNDNNNKHQNAKPRKPSSSSSGFQNVLHFMWDSTSTPAFRRGAKKMKKFLQNLNNDPSSPSHVFTFKHIHSVSCCSPGNQIPMYSGNMNGEGDYFVNAEPHPESTDWIWNIARDELGFKTFWSLDNCPDKSARDYHAFPTVDSRVVAPICLAGVLLSHKERSCLGGKTVDEHVLDGLTDFWKSNKNEKKFAAIQMIAPHEETEKQLIEVDDLVAKWFENEEVFTREELENTMIVLWSDHGINFGKYASTHDGEIEKMFPFCFIITPRKSTPKSVVESLRSFEDRLVTPYDIFSTVRSLMYLPEESPPKFNHDRGNPPLPRPSESHIMASFQKKEIIPLDLTSRSSSSTIHHQQKQKQKGEDRNCDEANIPIEFCSCLSWSKFPLTGIASNKKNHDDAPVALFFNYLVKEILKEHRHLLKGYEDKCEDVEFDEIVSVYGQIWPLEYKPPSKDTAKKVWMKPNRDFLKVTYRTKSGGVFVGVVSIAQGIFAVDGRKQKQHHHKDDNGDDVDAEEEGQTVLKISPKFTHDSIGKSEAKSHAAILDVVRLDRMDAMKKKCGIVQKVPEQLCICKY